MGSSSKDSNNISPVLDLKLTSEGSLFGNTAKKNGEVNVSWFIGYTVVPMGASRLLSLRILFSFLL
jgi:hypothetical protein